MKQDNIFLIGPMGAGKTSAGRYLAKKLNKHFYDTDEAIEKKSGANLHWIVDLEGMAGYRDRELKVIDELSRLPNIVLSTGGGCVETAAVREILQERGMVVYMEVTLETQLKRLKRDKKRPLLQGDDPQAVLIRLWEEREPFYEDIADLIVVTDHRSVDDVCTEIFQWLER
jgi:shikimate kinase